MRNSLFWGRTIAARGLIRDMSAWSTAYFADCRPMEFLVGTAEPFSEVELAHLDTSIENAVPSPRMSTKEQRERIELLQGTLDLLILRTLLLGPAHGHAIAKAIEFKSDEVLQVEQGSLYPALHRLTKRGWISVEDGTSENNRPAKFYRLTRKGRRQLVLETSKWDKFAGAISRILRPAKQGGKS